METEHEGEGAQPAKRLEADGSKEMYREMQSLADAEFEKKYGKEKPKILNPSVYAQQDIQQYIILNGESMTARQYKIGRILTFVSFLVSFAALVTSFLLATLPWTHLSQAKKAEYWFRHNGLFKINVVIASCCFVPLAISSFTMARQFFLSRSLARSGEKLWVPKRKSITLFALCRLVAQDVNIFFWLLQNAYALGNKCSFLDQFVTGCTLVQWSCLNFQFTLNMIWAACLSPWLDKDGNPETSLPGRKNLHYTPDPLVMDQPLNWRHIPKVIIGLTFQAEILFYAVWVGKKGGIGNEASVQNHIRNRALGYPACINAIYQCRDDVPFIVNFSFWLLMVVLHAVVTFYYIEQIQGKLERAGPYLLWERPHKMLKILETLNGWGTSMSISATIGLFLAANPCMRIIIPWYGILPLQVTMSINACTNAFYYFPRKAGSGDVVLQGWLRELVWREKDTPRLRKSMIKALPEFRELLAKESVFCFDAAAKLLVWTDLVYTVEDKAEARAAELEKPKTCCWSLCWPFKQKTQGAENGPVDEGTETGQKEPVPLQEYALEGPAGSSPSETQTSQEQPPLAQDLGRRGWNDEHRFTLGRKPLSQRASGTSPDGGILSLKLSADGYLETKNSDVKVEIRKGVASEAELGLAMRLFGLTEFEVLLEDKLQTKVLLSWNTSCLVIAFRGTANTINAKTDLKIFRQPHHILKDSAWKAWRRPLVHGGFLKSWLSQDLHKLVVARVRSIVSRSTVSREEFKIYVTGHSLGGALATLAACDIASEGDLPDVKCITFGAPRTGNHAFASISNELVPDTWHVINDRDAVPRVGKFLFLFKRSGQRVLVNRFGDCRVRPDPVQVSIHQEGFSVKAHFLNSYRKALGAILKSQMIPARQRAGGQEAFEAFAADDDMRTLGLYLGIDMKKLLEVPPSNIKLPRRKGKGLIWSFARVQIFVGTSLLVVRLIKFLMGEDFAQFVKGAIERIVPPAQEDSESSSIASIESREEP